MQSQCKDKTENGTQNKTPTVKWIAKWTLNHTHTH